MTTNQRFVEPVCAQVGASHARADETFGASAHGVDQVAGMGDNPLFVAPTAADRPLPGAASDAPSYRVARQHLLIDAAIDDRKWLQGIVEALDAALLAPQVQAGACNAPKTRERP